MSIAPDSVPVPELSFAGTVDLALLHRGNPSEAFLTDAIQTGPRTFVAAALLPETHAHYLGPTDPMLLLECARQAETYAAHTMYGVELDAKFVLRNWSAELARGGPQTSELTLTVITRNPKLMRDRIRGLDYDFELWSGGARVGRVLMEVGYVSGAAYSVLRSRKHNGPPPSSDDLVPTPGRPVEPARVGRDRDTDTVLRNVEAGPRAVTAVLRVPVENPSLFDHAQDHVPAMVLMEAARQLAGLATHEWGGPAPDATRMVDMASSFGAYAELTEPIELTAKPDGGAVEVRFRQSASDLAQARIIMAEQTRGRGATWLEPRS